MAMKSQSDLLGIIELFGEQLNAVGIRFDHVTFIEGPITKKKRDWDLWSYVPDAKNTTDKTLIPYIETPYFTKTAKAVEAYKRTGNPIQVKSFTKKEKDEFLDHYWKYAPASLNEIVSYVYTTPGSIIVDAFLKEVTVSLVRWDLEPCTKEELAIFERFAKEFRQTYIRFLDIKRQRHRHASQRFSWPLSVSGPVPWPCKSPKNLQMQPLYFSNSLELWAAISGAPVLACARSMEKMNLVCQ